MVRPPLIRALNPGRTVLVQKRLKDFMLLRVTIANVTPRVLAECIQTGQFIGAAKSVFKSLGAGSWGISASVFESLGAGSWGIEPGATAEFAVTCNEARVVYAFVRALLVKRNEQAAYVTRADHHGTVARLWWADGRIERIGEDSTEL